MKEQATTSSLSESMPFVLRRCSGRDPIAAITELLFGLVAETPRLPSSARKAFRQFELGPTVPGLQAPFPTQVASAVKLRPEHEYGKLATDIIQSAGWKSLPPKAGRARNRAIGRLMLRALNDG
ncbi:hypothetical protein BMW22_26655 (plasmid) [Rhizobium leguminosarum]|uniref:Uncharacterized protein n=1 Tax=Rhizobium leguminosarum TaxID=384 RepID=A0A1L3ZHV4_RHILE|nr:hypothetical protein BMW22_26655 [Rhizobium leguminosarum]